MRSIPAFCVCLLASMPFAARAEDNPCALGITPDVIQQHYDQATTVALLKVMSLEQRNQYRKSQNGSLSIPDFADLGFSNDRDASQWKEYFDKLNYHLESKQSQDLLLVSVPESARADYFKCVTETSRKNNERLVLVLGDKTGGKFLDITLHQNQRRGGGDNPITDLQWKSSDPAFEEDLKKLKEIGGPGAELAVDYRRYEPAKGFWLTVAGGGVTEKLNIPAAPVIAAMPKPQAAWYDAKKVSVPLKVRVHYAQVGNCDVIFRGEDELLPPTDCSTKGLGKVSSDGKIFVGVSGAQIQEIQVDWDREAAAAFGIPAPLTEEQLSFGVRCSFKAGFTPSRWYPNATSWAKPGVTCGNEAGEPVMDGLSMKLTGTLASHFDLKFWCATSGGVQGPYSSTGVCTSEWVPEFIIQITSRGPQT